ncbi:MAG: hypothetical protein A2504_17015 [Bdellovibrionales bacterium RIFOXYD12_FULL_39_22]|nr:MAG: hypothetical protein A2385_17840 [Bdellovibrionales bacterium RIFOXYB1_FULL_39_21]OFZ44035.1 MAG: hypothetical protein A2485_14975 [Bdellovibrionales bacterium RIFOXYC12_FULL_39_17]OFZ48288.1 MAG: hypothetical protein A2404_08705 [Bdellovibrionales bacterium RIFOXYC1_FULL_39_130]OFZ76616.1 MAG: hypothetical protein A2560_17785 [Bdellovibrionales bacterium RIFOXYD1_FULL_39_84]OFZ95537.1 MAG: hypothetical protein A2504_17015 [Bdellovibrionales bacterium RIFOXYD12_FULL_39_22]
MIKFLIMMIPIIALAGFSDNGSTLRYQYKEDSEIKSSAATTTTTQATKKKSKSGAIDGLMSKLLASQQNIETLLSGQEKSLIVRKEENAIPALSRMQGIILNSVLAMNMRPSLFVVKVADATSDIDGAELRCSGVSFEKRMPATCDMLVTDDGEFSVDVKVWDLDGADGAIADYYYSGEEKSFLTEGFSAFFAGVLDSAKDRIATPFGETTKDSGKNKILEGLTNVAGNAGRKVQESGDQKMSVVFINAGKEVLLFFNQKVILTKEES